MRHNQQSKDTAIYILPMDANGKKRTGWCNLGFMLAITALHALPGMINHDSSRTAWIVYPYFFTFLPIIYGWFGAVEYLGMTLRMTGKQYEKTIRRMQRSMIATLVFAVLGIVLEVIYMILHRDGLAVGPEVLFTVLHIPHILIVVLFGRFYDHNYANVTTEQ